MGAFFCNLACTTNQANNMAKRGPPGIQKLLSAESEANALIVTARQNRIALIKRARDDAENIERQLQEKMKKDISQIQDQARQGSGSVVELILKAVSEVYIEDDNKVGA